MDESIKKCQETVKISRSQIWQTDIDVIVC